MSVITWVIIGIAVIIIIYLLYSSNNEGFNDTYDNYLDYAKTVYKTDAGPKSDYLWAERDKDGYQLYDGLDEKIIKSNAYVEQLRADAFGRNDDTFAPGFPMGEDSYTFSYNVDDMRDPNPKTFEFNGNILTASQMNF